MCPLQAVQKRPIDCIDDCSHDFDDVKGVHHFVSTLRYGSFSDSMRLCQCHESKYLGGRGEKKDLNEETEIGSSANNHEEGSAEKGDGQM